MTEEKTDYLEVDDQIPGQNYVCLSFVSPETLIESKEAFKVAKFLQSICKDRDMKYEKVIEQYKDFTYKFQDELQKDFDEQNEFKTNIRGLKVRGTYNTRDEADKRAKKLQSLDADFHVFVGQVGYWLPWDPCADKIEDEQYINSQLNDMMEKYKDNCINKDIFYEEQKREKVKAAKEEAIQRKKEELEQKKLEDPIPEQDADPEQDAEAEPEQETPTDADSEKETPTDAEAEKETPTDAEAEPEPETTSEAEAEPEQETPTDAEPEPETTSEAEGTPEVIKESVGETVDADLKNSLESVDPWMANKLKESSQ
uniref:Uncharacterized protein n=1 Tax=viral metagenome TaxID=1070528 RepID=A0A6C0L3M2_9ZZZZ|tara:strand:+ start:4937 stop:5875 length:939 start_codon:yes stop_codon:yes gene_type:complete